MARLLRQAVLDRNWLDGMQEISETEVAVVVVVANAVAVVVLVTPKKFPKVKTTLLPKIRLLFFVSISTPSLSVWNEAPTKQTSKRIATFI